MPEDARGEDEIRAWLVQLLADHLQVRPETLDPEESFPSLGIDSFEAAVLSGDVEAWLGRELPATLLLEHPSIEELSRHLAHAPAEPRSPSTRIEHSLASFADHDRGTPES